MPRPCRARGPRSKELQRDPQQSFSATFYFKIIWREEEMVLCLDSFFLKRIFEVYSENCQVVSGRPRTGVTGWERERLSVLATLAADPAHSRTQHSAEVVLSKMCPAHPTSVTLLWPLFFQPHKQMNRSESWIRGFFTWTCRGHFNSADCDFWM